ncbi:MAG: hypothetical protein IKO99_05545 [Bacteroidales bacterium]|nr:hypothetical protein [Bacteroidales bacterium]
MKRGICPYPGLRPFTEEESIFFKGRDLHIRQIVKLLEENKMAFITGASGDGKSSMVYAGVVPYIRAGFFKADFNSWIIADFKPQRNPLASLAEALATQMNADYSDFLSELDNGFSSVVDLYKRHGFYAEDANQGKNLLIIADQFEEVFTNSDNFNDGEPSEESYTAINLLLETVRIAVTENLPVYVIFTMRSDFISQCTVFKNLPEFIAYSQFFVPQLKRTEICQVIEEPAALAGGKVSDRLREVIVNNLNNGFDQLPVLQHALHLLWKMADNGQKELDLIHLAKIAGISKEVLSGGERKEFDKWFAMRPDYEKKYFEKPDLNNVLNAHAGILYESAFDYFQKNAPWAEKSITNEESKEIIEAAFKSLVKIDNNRPVRNRCTVDEITGIIGKENITNATVCGVLNIFRSPDNTLLRPFIEDGELETQYLSGDTVLDITHEALIRNWKMFAQWGAQMESNAKDYHDFNSQVSRWLSQDKSPEFLLTSGSYNYFNDWYNKSRPNPYWIARYDTSKISEQEKRKKAVAHFEDCTDYLEESHNALLEKEQARKRRMKVIFVAIAFFLLTMAGFTSWALMEKSSANEERDRAEKQKIATERQRELAEQQRGIADQANIQAQVEKSNAQREAEEARKAKLAAQEALNRANTAFAFANASRLEAEKNLTIAEEQRKKAQEEEQKAKEEEMKAKIASDSAARLYNITLCNMLAMNAKNQYEDKDLNIKLAWAAYKMNETNKDKQNDAILYDAMLYAVEQTPFKNTLSKLPERMSAFRINASDKIEIVSEDGTVNVYDLKENKAKNTKSIKAFEGKTLVERALFTSGFTAVLSTKDRNLFFVDIESGTVFNLEKQKGYLSQAVMLPDNLLLILGFTDGRIIITIPTRPKDKPITEANFGNKITGIYPTNNGIYILQHNGRLLKWNYKTGEKKILIEKEGQNFGFALEAIPDKNLLAVSFADGNVKFLNMTTDLVVASRTGGHVQIEKMCYDSKTGFLAVASADKRIALINTADIKNGKIVSIEEHSLKGKVKSAAFNSLGTVFALTEDNQVRFWYTDINKYAAILSEMHPKPLTPAEKELILGKEFSNIDDF